MGLTHDVHSPLPNRNQRDIHYGGLQHHQTYVTLTTDENKCFPLGLPGLMPCVPRSQAKEAVPMPIRSGTGDGTTERPRPRGQSGAAGSYHPFLVTRTIPFIVTRTLPF